MKGIEFDPEDARIRIVNGARVVATTDGTLINLLPTLETFSGVTLDYADPPKSQVQTWTGFQQVEIGVSQDDYLQRQTIQHFYARSPQELETHVDLMDAPDGADIFVGHVRLERTTDPTHNWWAVPLTPLLPENAWVAWNGSGMLEHAFGLTRLLHLEIADGKLRLALQQSVGPKVGGAGTQGGKSFDTVFRRREEGASYVQWDVNNAGVLVWTSNSSPHRQQKQQTSSTGSPLTYNPPQYFDWCPDPSAPGSNSYPAATDPTNYRSVYTADVKGYFGRRS